MYMTYDINQCKAITEMGTIFNTHMGIHVLKFLKI